MLPNFRPARASPTSNLLYTIEHCKDGSTPKRIWIYDYWCRRNKKHDIWRKKRPSLQIRRTYTLNILCINSIPETYICVPVRTGSSRGAFFVFRVSGTVSDPPSSGRPARRRVHDRYGYDPRFTTSCHALHAIPTTVECYV